MKAAAGSSTPIYCAADAICMAASKTCSRCLTASVQHDDWHRSGTHGSQSASPRVPLLHGCTCVRADGRLSIAVGVMQAHKSSFKRDLIAGAELLPFKEAVCACNTCQAGFAGAPSTQLARLITVQILCTAFITRTPLAKPRSFFIWDSSSNTPCSCQTCLGPTLEDKSYVNEGVHLILAASIQPSGSKLCLDADFFLTLASARPCSSSACSPCATSST